MKITCGVFIFDKNGLLLIGHPTGFPFVGNLWSIPKGEPDHGEVPEVAALREVVEETSLVLDSTKIKYVGYNSYKSGKKTIYAYSIQLEEDSKTLITRCDSCFINKDGVETFEIDAFQWVTPAVAETLLHEAQVVLLPDAIKKLNSNTNG